MPVFVNEKRQSHNNAFAKCHVFAKDSKPFYQLCGFIVNLLISRTFNVYGTDSEVWNEPPQTNPYNRLICNMKACRDELHHHVSFKAI